MSVIWKTPAIIFLTTNFSKVNIPLKLRKMCSCNVGQLINSDARALHYVFKVPDRKETIRFYRDILGMKVLRHEEFAEGCEATCNGPYDNRWSKTMIGYGPEDDHFVFELTYNYPIKHYDKGNDFIGVTLINEDILKRAAQNKWPISNDGALEAPGGYKFFIVEKPKPDNAVAKITLACSNLSKTIEFWNTLLGLKVYTREDGVRKIAKIGYSEKQTKLEFVQIDEPVNRAQAFGRIAFSCSDEEQVIIESRVKKAKAKILVPLTSLDTPGKATVRVIILADPDGHEICFVNDDAFRELSKYAPEDEKILNTQLRKEGERAAERSKEKKNDVNEYQQENKVEGVTATNAEEPGAVKQPTEKSNNMQEVPQENKIGQVIPKDSKELVVEHLNMQKNFPENKPEELIATIAGDPATVEQFKKEQSDMHYQENKAGEIIGTDTNNEPVATQQSKEGETNMQKNDEQNKVEGVATNIKGPVIPEKSKGKHHKKNNLGEAARRNSKDLGLEVSFSEKTVVIPLGDTQAPEEPFEGKEKRKE